MEIQLNAGAWLLTHSARLYWQGKPISRSTLHELAEQVNQMLSPLPSGSHLALIRSNDLLSLVTIIVAWQRGLVLCPLNPKLPAATINHWLDELDCQYYLSDDNSYHGQRLALSQQRLPIDFEKISPSACACLLLTSGSSGRSKAVVLQHQQLWRNAEGALPLLGLDQHSQWLWSLPQFHIGGLMILIRCILADAAIVLPDHQKSLLGQLQQDRISHASLVHTQLQRLLNDPAWPQAQHHLHTLILGGGFIGKTLITQCQHQQIRTLVSYGLTEMASMVTLAEANHEQHLGSALAGRQLRINDNGEILVKGDSLFSGYWLDGEVHREVDADGWFHTRDRGHWQQQSLVVDGRLDNMFISGGENIQPEDIERAILQLTNAQMAVVVPVADNHWGQRPVAIIQWPDDRSRLSLNQLRQILKSRLASYQLPDHLMDMPTIDAVGLKVSRQSILQAVQQQLDELAHINQ